MGWNKKIADQIIDPGKLNIVSPNYNPVEARKNNSRLQELYTKGQEHATTYETNLATQLVSGMLSEFPDTTEMDDLLLVEVGQKFDQVSTAMKEEAKKREISIAEKIEKLSADKKLSPTEMKFQLEREKQTLQHTEETHVKRQDALNRTKQAFQYSIEIGCKSKQDVISTVSKIIEANTTKNESTREKMLASIERTKQRSSEKPLQQHDKPKIFVKENNTSSNNNAPSGNKAPSSNSGFTNTISLIFIITFIIGIILSIGYMFYKNIIG